MILEKKPYNKPKIKVHGNITTITNASGSKCPSDTPYPGTDDSSLC